MRIRVKYILAGLGVVLLTLPVWARTESAELEVTEATEIAGTQLRPGEYEIKVKDGAAQVSVVRDGKTVAQVPCQWIQLPNKAANSQVITSNNKVTEVDFGGKTEALQFR